MSIAVAGITAGTGTVIDFNEPEGELLLIFPEWKPVILGTARGPRRRASAAGGENGQYNHKM